ITGEYLAQIYTKQYGLNITILRYPFIYGPGRIMPDPINALIYKAKNKENITLNGLEQRLEFIYVKDAVRAIWLALNSKNTHGEIFNIGTGYLASMKEIVAIVQEIFPNVSIKEG
ncbi:NAD-dependent epimerase/dehydratase family protein, partial [Alkalihalophilus pseudofirmus]